MQPHLKGPRAVPFSRRISGLDVKVIVFSSGLQSSVSGGPRTKSFGKAKLGSDFVGMAFLM